MSDRHDDYEERLRRLDGEVGRLAYRLRGLSKLAWSSRRPSVVEHLGHLVEITASLEHEPPRTLPPIADHALGDAVAVVGRDAVEALTRTPDPERLGQVAATVQASIDATR